MARTSDKLVAKADGIYAGLDNFEGWKKGLNNIQREQSLGAKDELADALNVDIDDLGKVRQRKGLNRILDGNFNGGMHVHNKQLYAIRNGDLIRYSTKQFASGEFLLGEVNQNLKMHFLSHTEKLYFSNGEISYCINQSGGLEEWGIDSPIIKPTCTVSSGGLLPKGEYMVAYSYLYGTYETGISPIQSVTVLEDDSQISVQCGSYAKSTGCLIYAQLGSELYLVGEGYNDSITDIKTTLGKLPKSEQSREFPPLINLVFYHGRIFGTKGDRFYFTDEFDFRQYSPKYNSASVDNTEIKAVIAFRDSLIIATQNGIYRYSGEVKNFSVEKLYDAEMISGTKFKHETKNIYGFLTKDGVFTMDDTGRISNISESSVAFADNYENGAAMFRMQDGIISVLFSLEQSGNPSEYENKNYINSKI